MNMGFEEDDLKPYIEPVQDWADIKRIEILTVIFPFILTNSQIYTCQTKRNISHVSQKKMGKKAILYFLYLDYGVHEQPGG